MLALLWMSFATSWALFWPEQLNESDRDKIIMEVEKGRRDKMLDIIASKIENGNLRII